MRDAVAVGMFPRRSEVQDGPLEAVCNLLEIGRQVLDSHLACQVCELQAMDDCEQGEGAIRSR